MNYVTCPKCSESNPESSIHCSNCGESLRGAKHMKASTKAYVKSSDIILEKARAGEYHCGVYEKRNGVFEAMEQFKEYLNYLYGNQGKTVHLKVTSATTQTIKVMVPWKEIKAILRRPDNHLYLFFNHPTKKRQEWVDILIGIETSTGVQFGSEPELECQLAEIFVEKCKAKGIQVQLLA